VQINPNADFTYGFQSRRIPSGCLCLIAAMLLGIWLWLNYVYVKQLGVFESCGIDYALLVTGSRLVFSDQPMQVFNRDAIAKELRGYAIYYGKTEPGDQQIGPLPYPVPMFWLYRPFSFLDPISGFKLWTIVNLVIATVVLWQIAAPLGGLRAVAVTALALCFPPLVAGIFFGQPVVVLVLALFLAYRKLQQGKDFQAGLWAGVLFLKMQYPLVLALILAIHRRWQAVAGMALTGGLLLAASLITCGFGWIPAYLQTVQAMSGFREVDPILWPSTMINWRGFLVRETLLPEELGKQITLLLSVLTIASLLLIWRGPWQPTHPRFSLRILATFLVTLLAAIHSHIHGGALLLVPALEFLVAGSRPRYLRSLLIGCYLVNNFTVWSTGWSSTTATVAHASLVVCLLAILYWELRNKSHQM
jgi:hypothetical protein